MTKPFFRYFLFIILFLKITGAFAQGTSNKGTDFWLGYGTHIAHPSEVMVVYITSDVNTTATVAVGALSFSQTVNIVANVVSSVTIPSAAHLGTEGISDLGIHITAVKPIIVYSHIYASSVSGATLVLPTNTLGKDYYSINYKQVSNSNFSASFFFVVAVEDDTQVEITPSQATQGGRAANVKFTVSLNKGQIYHVLGAYTNQNGTLGVDLTGSKIKSVSTTGVCKKIAVFSGSSKISISCLNTNTAGSADNLFQQDYPTSTWGKKFITVPLKDRNFDVYRIVKSDPNAVVTLNGIVISASFVNNFYYDFESQVVNNITSDKPIQVVQYAVTQGRGINCSTITGDVGDPEMIFLNPLEQTLTQITMYSSPNFKILKHFINIVIKNEGVASFKVDGVSFSSSFIPFAGNTAYSYAQISVLEGTHNLSSDIGFNAIAYGFGSAESYGYAAGANLTAFGVQPINQGSQEIVQTGCVGSAYQLNISLPYQPTELYLDKGDGSGEQLIPNKLINQTTVDGETKYFYELVKDLVFNTPNTYTFRVRVIKPTIDDCGTGDSFSFDLIINPKPTASFTAPDKSCLNNEVSFIHVPDVDESSITDYLWDFNGEGTSTLKDPKFTFKTTGVKKIKFSTKNNSGCWSDVFVKDLNVVQLPVSKFKSSTPSCETRTIDFTDQSTTIDGSITQWNWDFGDASSADNASIQNPNHIYASFGTYTVKLIAITDLGCADTSMKQVTINPLPIPNFDRPDICLDDASALFTNTTTIADNSALTYKWDFGDPTSANNTSTLKSPSHKYLAAKNYNVKLVVTSASNCITEITQVFTVNGSTPKAAFTIKNENVLCSDQLVSFEDRSTIDFGEITRIDWFYDDLTPNTFETDNQPGKRPIIKGDTAKIYTHKYPTFYSPEQRSVIVKMKTYSGNSATCISTITKSIILRAVPKADFSLPISCLTGGDAQFTNGSTYLGASTNMAYNWNFGDSTSTSNTSTNQDPIHHFTAAGNYKITLITTSANGCTATSSKIFKVDAAIGNPNFTISNANNLCSDQKVLFTDSATISFGELTKIEWYFDHSNFPNDTNYQLIDNFPASRNSTPRLYEFLYPKFSTPLTKSINVRMKVFSGVNCENEIIKTITLKAVPNVVFDSIPSVCEEKEPYMITQASEKSGFLGIGKYSGKGISSNGLFSPFSAGVGSHKITYTFTGDNGCEDIKSQDIIVNPTPTVDAGPDQIILIGGQAKLTGLASGKNITYKWTPSDHLDHDDIPNPIATPIEDIKYILTITSVDGCTVMDDVFIKVLQFPIISNTFTPNGDGVNDTWSIKYLDSYTNVSLKVYNRYGAEVFKADNYSNPWDGTQNGSPLPDGVYYYIISARGGELKYSGSVAIIH